MKTMVTGRRAISEIIAVILLVALALVAAVVLYGYWSSTASRAQTSSQATISASLSVPNGHGTGTIAINIENIGSVSISQFVVSGTIRSPSFGVSYPNLPPGSSGSLTTTTSVPVTAGVSYVLTVQVTYVNGATTTQSLSVVATD